MSKCENSTAGRTDAKLSLDEIHDLLSARRRRYALYCLFLYENPIRLPDVADQVSEWEREAPPTPSDSLHAYNELYHNHIPKLADASVVAYSQEEDMVELAENGAQLRPYLERAIEADLDVDGTPMSDSVPSMADSLRTEVSEYE